jgi:xanthine/CO dehydrogenase XdhC/CoxF family maturation factor
MDEGARGALSVGRVSTVNIVAPVYDSRPDTWQHIHTVQAYLSTVIASLQVRALEHDQSKLESPEVEVFDAVTPKLRELSYGSDEYTASLAEMGEGLAHHYAVNDHHPEHGDGTLAWMTLPQIVEMLCDWKAATMRHADGDLRRSIQQNADRFGYGPEMTRLLLNTATTYGWL